MYKSCSRCGKIHDSNYKCNVGRLYNGGDERALRSKHAWHKKAKEIKHKANHLCEVCRTQGTYTYTNLEVHHIDKVRENPDRLLDDDNLICLCVTHHKQADKGNIDKGFLIELVRKREGK